MLSRYSLLPLALAAAFPTLAADLPLYEGETTVVTATRFARDPSQLASDVTVITAEDIAKSSATDLPSLLARQPGIAMTQSGGIGQTSSLFLRGTNSNHTQLLIDGQRINAATTGTATWQLIPLELIDRIEIVRGGASGAYGADAIGGVVQIFTKRGGGKPRATASVEYGSYGHTATSAGIGGSAGNLRYNFTARASEDSGISATTPKNSQFEADRDGYRNAGFSGNLAYFINENHEIGTQLLYSNGRTEYDGGGSFPVAQNRLLNYNIYSRNIFLPNWESTVRLGESRDSYKDYWGINETRQQQVSWSNRFNSRAGNWLLGAETIEDSLRSSSQYTLTSRRTNAIFGGWSRTFGIHSLQANVRHDNNSQFGGVNSGNLGYSVELIKSIHAYTNIGRAFHIPTFWDANLPPGWGSDPNLKPEKAATREIGLKARLDNWKINTSIFDTRISDLIVYNTNTWMTENIPEAKIKGITLAFAGEINNVDISGNITWQDPRNVNSDKLLPRRSRVLGNAKAGYRLGDWRFFAELEGQGARFDAADNAATGRMHGYVLTHLGVDYQVAKDWRANLRVNNALDQSYELAKNYSTMRRNALIKLTWNGNL
ncbi:vitamin B12 transporter [Formivibrio citricus]|uniref:Vitamin B12 transporter n=1 Tax=Formivibrio citricus TaxID=83765 RepID=A0A1I4WZZ2_9NEIS|nr:TonB-dependent receptor [Formivibrio citricus]SFN19301.1 vitamin B12 transporter [Formivibrio citricus]